MGFSYAMGEQTRMMTCVMLDEYHSSSMGDTFKTLVYSTVIMACKEQDALTSVPGKLPMLFQVLVNISTKCLVDDNTVGLSRS